MKSKYSMFGVLLAIVMVVSFAIPGNLATPTPASADAGVCKWNYIRMPGSTAGPNDVPIVPVPVGNCAPIYIATESEKLVATANPDVILAAIDMAGARLDGGPSINFFASVMKGAVWPPPPNTHLKAALAAAGVPATNDDVWNIAASPDDPNFWAVVTGNATDDAPVNVWVTNNAGGRWEDTNRPISSASVRNA